MAETGYPKLAKVICDWGKLAKIICAWGQLALVLINTIIFPKQWS